MDFCCAVPVMVISCRRCRGLFVAHCTSKPNIGYLVISAGSCLSVMMVEWCLPWEDWCRNYTNFSMNFSELVIFCNVEISMPDTYFLSSRFLNVKPFVLCRAAFHLSEWVCNAHTDINPWHTCFANSMSPVYLVWAAKPCSFVNKCVQLQESFAQVFSYLFIVLTLFLFSFFYPPPLMIPKRKSKSQACGPFPTVLGSECKWYSPGCVGGPAWEKWLLSKFLLGKSDGWLCCKLPSPVQGEPGKDRASEKLSALDSCVLDHWSNAERIKWEWSRNLPVQTVPAKYAEMHVEPSMSDESCLVYGIKWELNIA